MSTSPRHYLDHAATTPLRGRAADAWLAVQQGVGNASSQHGSGRAARRTVEEARELIASLIGSRPSEVVFTSGGTEADNLAILGQARALDPHRPVAVSAVEHHSVLDAAEHLGADPARMDTLVLGVDSTGRIDQEHLARALERAPEQRPVLASVLLANNEIGTVNPVADVAELASEAGVVIHTDAVQAVGHLPVDFRALGVTSMSLAAHKFGGPTGVGALVIDREAACVPLAFGGGQERDLRSGTVDVAGVWASAVALDEAVTGMAAESARVAALRDRLVSGILARVDDVELNGADPRESGQRLPGNANFTFRGCSGEALIFLLDAAGVECSTGSACTAGVAEPSHVIAALGGDELDARSCLRFSLGHTTTDADVDAVLEAIVPAVRRARDAGLVTVGRRE